MVVGRGEDRTELTVVLRNSYASLIIIFAKNDLKPESDRRKVWD